MSWVRRQRSAARRAARLPALHIQERLEAGSEFAASRTLQLTDLQTVLLNEVKERQQRFITSRRQHAVGDGPQEQGSRRVTGVGDVHTLRSYRQAADRDVWVGFELSCWYPEKIGDREQGLLV